ncbi:PAS domain S-box protein [Oscillatoria acuminata]|uniref:Circadian input-output histidine kinase CikA n=1 Tax=Oscillatoria acuminata PCC 6304 TaxID=56110 RepID=K9TRQ5_9CYAN|nr:PAS domain S-box protein [Oscillatoria acuminata]AFY85235.1 PAS domain S-box [Oscillatoria acuminata PCC 6304]
MMEQQPAKRKIRREQFGWTDIADLDGLNKVRDWSSTALGAMETWHPSWRTAVSLGLASQFPTLLWWGPELVLIYNEAARGWVGDPNHPDFLGQPGREVLNQESWDILCPMLEQVFSLGEGTRAENCRLVFDRPGSEVVGWFNLSHSPIYTEDNQVCGVLTTAIALPTPQEEKILDSLAVREGESAPSARILLVDDNSVRRDYVESQLVRWGYQVKTVGDRTTALDAAQDFSPSAILTDAIAPEIEDLEWVQQLKARVNGKDIPVIRVPLPAMEGESTELTAETDWGPEFLHPSASIHELLNRVSTHLEIAELSQDPELREQPRRNPPAPKEETLTLLESITDGFACFDRQGRYTYINAAGATLLNQRAENLVGQYLWDVFPESVGSSFYRGYHRALSEGRTIGLEADYPPLQKRFEVRFYPYGEGLCAYFREQREGAESATLELHQERDVLAAVVNAIPNLVVILDRQGRIVGFNQACETMTGYCFAEMQGLYIWDRLLVPEEIESVKRVFENLRSTAMPNEYVNAWLTKEGSRRAIAWSNTVLCDAQGEMEYIIATGIDISDRYAAEAALRQSTERFQIAAENTSDLIYEWEIATGRVEWFGNIDEQLGYEAGSFVRTRQTWLDCLHPSDRERVENAIDRHLQTREPFDEEYQIQRADGIYLYWSDRGTALWNEQGQAYKWIGATTDITLRQWAQTEIIKLNRTLKRRVKELQTLLKFIPIGIAISEDPHCEQIRFNSVLAHTLGISSPVLPHFNPLPEATADGFKLYHNGQELAPEEFPMRYAATHQVEVLEFEVDAIHEDGRVIEFLTYAAPILDEEGQTRGTVGAFVDITHRKQIEEALRNSEELYRSLAEALPQMIFLCTCQGKLEYCNPSGLNYMGLSLEQILEQSTLELIHPSDRAEALAQWRNTIATETSYEIEVRLQRWDGLYRWHTLRLNPITGVGDRLLKWLGTATDIDDRKRSQQQERFLATASSVLANSLDYQTTLDSLAHLTVPSIADWCAIDVVEKDGTIERLAVAHTDPAKEELAKELFRRYPPKKEATTGQANVFRTGQSELYPHIPDSVLVEAASDAEHLRILRELRLNSGMFVPLKARGRTLGTITFMLEVGSRCYDRTDLMLAEKLAHRAAIALDNARLYREAQDANRLKDEFLATLSHELRTPLNCILGWSQILRNRRLSEEKMGLALETIERNARLQFQLIEDLLDVSRIITGKLRLNVTSVSLSKAIEEAIESVRPAAEAKHIQLRTQLDFHAGPVSGDRDRLQQIVWNLLSNAIKFTPSEGCVTVILEQFQTSIQIRIVDTGQGIKREFLPYVFDRFRQADSSSTRAYNGLGLGLAIVRHLTELHGGTVSADSPGLGKGAMFTVELPLMPRCELPERNESQALDVEPLQELNPTTSLEGVRVLVVDDEADARGLLTLVLEECGAQVQAAASVRQALIAIPQFYPQVLISDIAMPEEDGYTLIYQIRRMELSEGGYLPAAAVTAYARSEDRTRALKAGYDIHLPKPVDTAELIAVVERLAARSRHTS